MKMIPLTQGKAAVVDDGDVGLVTPFAWHAHFDGANWYARSTVTVACGSRGQRKQIGLSMHRLIMGDPADPIDHINGNGLDNRRENLRVCTPTQNQWNARARKGSSSKYKGVAWHMRLARWQAKIRVDGRAVSCGTFENEIEAALAYDRAARFHFATFARVNFPDVASELPPLRSLAGASSVFFGVSLDRKSGRWQAQVWHGGKRLNLGTYDDEIAAARAYDEAVARLRGTNTRLNFQEHTQ